MDRSHRILLVCILVVACLLRLAVVMRHAGTPLSGDEPGYDSIAWNLVIGHGYARVDSKGTEIVTATRGPSYVVLLALLYKIAGHNVMVPLLLQVLMDTASCLLVFLICRRLFRRTDAALISAFLFAVYPQIVFSTKMVLTETFVIFTMLLGILYYLRYSLTGSRSALIGSAIALGLCGLSKPIVYLVPILFTIVSIGERPFRENVKVLATQMAVIVLLMSPWIVRNALTFHAFIPGVTNGGVTFWGGTGPDDGRVLGGLGDPGAPEYAKKAVRDLSEQQREKWFYRDGMRIIRENPRRFAMVVLSKIPHLWFNIPFYEPLTPRNWFFVLYNSMMGIFAAIGIVALRPPRVMARLLAALVLYWTGIHMVFFSVFRYSLPIYAFMFCFSAAGIVVVAERLGLHRVVRRKTTRA